MPKVKIYGAGSIGNHMAHGCRQKGWDVLMCDTDSQALERTKRDIYPGRYGRWDKDIQLVLADQLPADAFDLVIIGTPPDTHIPLALAVLREETPKALLIEKPLSGPGMVGCGELADLAKSNGTFVGVGYNHTLTQNTRRAEELLRSGLIGEPQTITALFREFWGGIFVAHPWLSGPRDTYLGFSERGGGALGEHSHAVNIWQHFALLLGQGRIEEVSAVLDMVEEDGAKYDRLCQLSVKTETGLVGNIVQDVISWPTKKYARIQGTAGVLEWHVNYKTDHDAVLAWTDSGSYTEELISKDRPQDFAGQLDLVEQILAGHEKADSPIDLERGLETMLVILAAHRSHLLKRTVSIDYSAGYGAQAIKD